MSLLCWDSCHTKYTRHYITCTIVKLCQWPCCAGIAVTQSTPGNMSPVQLYSYVNSLNQLMYWDSCHTKYTRHCHNISVPSALAVLPARISLCWDNYCHTKYAKHNVTGDLYHLSLSLRPPFLSEAKIKLMVSLLFTISTTPSTHDTTHPDTVPDVPG